MLINKKKIVNKRPLEEEESAIDSESGASENGDISDDNGSLSADDDSDDNDDDGGFSVDDMKEVKVAKTKNKTQTKVEHAPAKKLKQLEDKVKPPTLEEINELKETRNLYHSNLFRLQVKEMLTELKIKDKYNNYINNWLENFKLFLNKLKVIKEKEDADELQWLQHCPLQVPLALQQLGIKNPKKLKFQFAKPTTEPFLIGAAATQTLLGPQLEADVCVLMPIACFQKENYLNLAYEQKRALYLTFLGAEMLKSEQFPGLTTSQLSFSYHANNPLKSVLVLTPPSTSGSIAHKLRIRIFVAADEQAFKLSRFVPWNSNVRPSLFAEHDEAGDNKQHSATPNYNAGVLFDLTIHRNQQQIDEVFGKHVNFQAGLLLLKVWMRQRQLHVGYGGFNAHILAMFIIYLFKQRKMHANMSSYQVARTVWNQLAHSAWDECNKGISLADTAAVTPNQPTLEQFHNSYAVVFVDQTGFLNICANMSTELYRRVRAEAKLAVDMLNDAKLNSFRLLFMTPLPLYTQFDHFLKISKPAAIEQILELHVPPADRYNFAGFAYPQLLKVVSSLLRQGLGERVHTLLPIESSTECWPCNKAAPNVAKELHLGIKLNPEHAFEVLNKGPESLAEDAEEFRKFWGDKAQLRRFQDGSITESVVWATTTDALSKKRLIVRTIVQHLLQHHFQLEPTTDFFYVAGELDIVYQLTAAFKTSRLYEKYKIAQDTDAEHTSLSVIRCFDDLARKLHDLNELPLEIVSIAPISPVFRYCEPTPVLPQARYINSELFATHVLHAIIQLGLSSKWPNELTALRALKTAFYIQIAKLLRDKHHLHTRVTYDGVFVLKQGYCFAFELAHPKEVALLKREKTERGITQYIDCNASIALERRHYVLPKVNGALHALYQLQPAYGGTVMIAKRWLYAQLIDDGLWPDECTELLIATLFLNNQADHVTCSPQTGFIRFLQLLAHTDWRTELFLVNFNSSMEENEISILEQRFNEERDTFPAICIVTAYDQQHSGKLWTSAETPNKNIIARVTILARQALTIIEQSVLSTATSFVKPSKLFTASSEGYDLVIQLKPDLVPNTLAYDFGTPFAALTKPNWRLPLADTNFLCDAVNKLREAYADFAAFFYNPAGGKEIAIVWKPSTVFDEKEFKVNDVHGCTPTKAGTNIVRCLKETLIEDFKFILKDFYLRIDTVEAVQRAAKVSAARSRCFATLPPKSQSMKPLQKVSKPKLHKKKAVHKNNNINKKHKTKTGKKQIRWSTKKEVNI